MLCLERPWAIYVLAASILVSAWTLGFRVHDAITDLLFPTNTSYSLAERTSFIDQAKSVEFPSPIEFAPIREVCRRNGGFRPGLLFTCEGQHGGVGMVRNQILRCIRYAISAGAAIVVPSMQLRSASDIVDIETGNETPLDFLFDRSEFIRRLTEGCPGMRVYDSVTEFPHWDHRASDLDMIGSQFEPNHPPEGLSHPHQWRSSLDAWLATRRPSLQFDYETPLHIRLGQSFLEYPASSDGAAFAREFGKILSFREDTREMAARVLMELKERFSLPIDPAVAISARGFYGAHLRLEEDAIEAWPPSEGWKFSRAGDQFAEHANNIARSGLDVVYVASGDQAPVDLFARYLGSSHLLHGRNISVVTKGDLLPEADLARLKSLAFDQQALVDFLVMFKSSRFMGVAHSSFPWTVALRRHELSRYANYAVQGLDVLRDEYSTIMGVAEDYPYLDPFTYGLWP